MNHEKTDLKAPIPLFSMTSTFQNLTLLTS